MGRYPFLTWVNKYLGVKGKTYSESTVREVRRRYRRMDNDLKALVREGEVQSANPEKISAEDVLAYIGFQKDKGMKETAISHKITVLNSLLLFAGNSAVQQCRMRYPNAMPKKRQARMASMDDGDFHHIIAEARKIQETDWNRLKAYTVVVLCLCAGLRCKEVRLSKVSDLDTRNWVIQVEHVKGEGSYGEPRKVIIRPEAREILTKYLRARKAIVSKKCPRNQALFPAMRDEEDGFFSANGIERLKILVESETGIKFDLRMCRRTFGQMFIDQGLNLDAVSVMMGHATTKTTETYYCRKRQEVAIREAQELWTGKMSHPDAKNPKIESRFEVTGYV
jgi:integrase/recombinase XerD